MATLDSLQSKIRKLQAQADALIAKKSSAVIEKIRELMSTHGLTTADIDAHTGGKKRGPKPGTKAAVFAKASAAKYQDPKTGATWSGHGRAPGWIANAKDRSRFLIQDGADAVVAATGRTVSKAKTAVKKASTAGGATAYKGQPKGPQPAKYRDPKSGATWSGRGPAPAWLAGAKDRRRFLIDGASTAADAKPAVTKAVGKKAPTVKKTAAKKAVSAKTPAKKAAAKDTVRAAVKKAPAKKAPRQSASMPAPVGTVESGAELTT
ncbi:DNA-binding protein H-NS [Paraburkholderia sp. BL23I1N1]|uniref:H-NS family nucleoid-associated regulatory protein n=1 Tax=Paraburkholderia sp. BL23I1N1 TaxID=1938802 RepID=UPI000E721D85|nr:H-NS family nucleoid-associated regulatory protein [Paraburkholderia sp. BL23I1N1]RKE25259.1 DNA-binding protein H-NS [Paraburkholderia sp. BL23I1N1]